MSMALAAARQRAEEELLGWAYITNQLLLENALAALADVEEPARRAALEVEYAAGLAALLRAEWTATQQQLQDARNSIQQIANVIAHHRDGQVAHGVCADAEPPAVSLRRLLDDFTAFAEATQQKLLQQERLQQQQQQQQERLQQQQQQERLQQQQERLQQQEQQQQQDETVSLHGNVQTLYTRILPPPPVNPTARTLLSVRDQVRELRPETGVSPYGIVHTPRLQKYQHNQEIREKGEYTPHLTASPLHTLYTLQTSPSAVRHHTPHSGTQDSVSSAALAWRERMTSLQAGLRDLKRELGN
ncbi:uncharacterized protein TM35_000352090 [Trypanosoma theileri]|uniref:Uncharacterized protein n=1 Tax=Trypanosoma theileri TaxID=67003 RepID=A0A1X0NL54_9TRYP|nr:uncharacterized protein TM35_000352090 [Trypanosoma theileri]ORC85465.1 hypothetical protein TM35_000352090 [Trypanosoma theileri]